MSSVPCPKGSLSIPDGFLARSPSAPSILESDLSSRVAEALELFSEIDTLGLGFITFDNLRSAMLSNAPGTDEDEIKSVFNSLAQDGDETITKKTFIEGLHKFYGADGDLNSRDGSDDDESSNRRLDDGRRWAASHVYEGLQNSSNPHRTSISRDSNQNLEVSEDAYQLSQALFRLLDKDGNGMLPVEELKQALAEIDSVMFSKDTLDDVVSLLDDGETGAVTEEEFTEGFAVLAAATSLDQLRDNIERFRTEKNPSCLSRKGSIKEVLYSPEDDHDFTELGTGEDLHHLRQTLENRSAQLEHQLQHAKISSNKIMKRLEIVQKENQIQCEEKQRLAKKLQNQGTSMRQLEENQEVYKKMNEAMKLRMQRLEEKYQEVTKEKAKMENNFLTKQKNLEREVRLKQSNLEKAKKIITHQRRSSINKNKKIIKKEETKRHESTAKLTKKSLQLTEAQKKIKLLEEQLLQKQKEYEKFVEISQRPIRPKVKVLKKKLSTSRSAISTVSANSPYGISPHSPPKYAQFPPNAMSSSPPKFTFNALSSSPPKHRLSTPIISLGDMAKKMKIDIEDMHPRESESTNSDGRKKSSSGIITPYWTVNIESVLNKLKLRKNLEKDNLS